MTRSLLLRPAVALFFAEPFSEGQQSTPSDNRTPDRRPDPLSDIRPRWALIVQYFIASAFCVTFLGLLILDPFLPDYDVPTLLYMFMLVVIAFALPGSENIATTLINAIFRRKSDQ